MGKLVTKIKSSKLVNTGVVKKVKDKIYFKFISPKEEKKTDKYRKEILDKIYKAFKDCNWQLMSGSLLRYYRDKTMEGQDLDIYILRSDFEKVKENVLKEGFTIKQVFFKPTKEISEYKFLYKGCEVDIFMVDSEKKDYSHRFNLEKKDSKGLERKVVNNTQKVYGKDLVSYKRNLHYFSKNTDYKYNDITFKGPLKIEESIYDIYGENWKVYDPTYDPRKDPPNNVAIPYEDAFSYVFIKPIDKYEDIFKDIKLN